MARRRGGSGAAGGGTSSTRSSDWVTIGRSAASVSRTSASVRALVGILGQQLHEQRTRAAAECCFHKMLGRGGVAHRCIWMASAGLSLMNGCRPSTIS